MDWLRACWVFCKDSWRLMRGPPTEIEREAERIKWEKEHRMVPSWMQFPSELEAERAVARRNAAYFKDPDAPQPAPRCCSAQARPALSVSRPNGLLFSFIKTVSPQPWWSRAMRVGICQTVSFSL